ncbi:pregnancy-specific glycoprotein 22-like [Acomys russatus]|uniref:pregnancy-specific glycoprotein 22-like n=1 Tax=Acomys russatus TaxID=60746 RepID=UPI0021E1D3BE|nr:pregnancy-specific glycoprotein 22-like [Acomys russatus]
MKVSSMLPCKGCTPWQGLLFTACLLTCWHLSTTDEVSIELVPPQVVEGENVLFLVHNLPDNLRALSWFKGRTNTSHEIALYTIHAKECVTGPVHSGREIVHSSGSLRILKVTQKDIGYYTLRTFNKQSETVSITSTYLHVNTFLWNCGRLATSAQPTIESLPPVVPEGGQVILKVHNVPENLLGFVWFKGKAVFWHLEIGRYMLSTKSSVLGPAHSGREEFLSNGILLFHNVTEEDAGLYTLRILSTDMKNEEAHVEIQVDTALYKCCNPLTSSKILTEPVPRYAAEGESVLLLAHNLPKKMISFSWYRSMYKVPAFKIVEYNSIRNTTNWWNESTGREIVYSSGSLLLLNVTQNDARMYTLETLDIYYKVETSHVQFHVNKPLTQPTIKVTDIRDKGDRSVMFTCVSPDIDTSISWFFNYHSLKITERMTLSPTKCGLRIDHVRWEDEGEYRCLVTNRVGIKVSHPVKWP